jgi:hypothetical protein
MDRINRYLKIEAWARKRYTKNGMYYTHYRGMIPSEYTQIEYAAYRRYILCQA